MGAGPAGGLSVSNGKCPILSKFSAGSGVSVNSFPATHTQYARSASSLQLGPIQTSGALGQFLQQEMALRHKTKLLA
jgi:hypothetical protein